MTRTLQMFTSRETAVQFLKVGLVGVANTVATFAIYNVARTAGIGVTGSLAIAFTLATLMSYVLNRRWSFRLNDSGENLTETWKFFAINVVAWAITEGLMRVAQAWFGPLSRLGENVALLVISGMILLPKFIGYREGVFGHALRQDAAEADTAERAATS